MYKILKRRELNPTVTLLEVEAPRVAARENVVDKRTGEQRGYERDRRREDGNNHRYRENERLGFQVNA